MPRRLAEKLILSLTVIVFIIGGVSGLISVKTQERQLLDAMILGADQLSKGITSATWHAMLADNRDSAYQVMQTIALKQGIDRIRIFNREGRLMFSTNQEDTASVHNKGAAACSPCHGSLEPRVRISIPSRVRIAPGTDGQRRLTMITPIYNERACSQAACHAHPARVKVLGVLDVALKLDPVDREVAAMQTRMVAVTGIEVVLISIFIFFFTRRFVGNPIRKLIGAAKAVSAMDLEQPVRIGQGSEELDELAGAFELMRQRLRRAMAEINEFTHQLETKVEERTEQLKAAHQKLLHSDRLASLGQLSASVAHEINNPLSGVLNLSMLMQRMLREDGIPRERLPDFRRYLAQVVQETTRVGRIVSDLLTFSRRSKPQRAGADLNRIVETTLSLVAHKLAISNVTVQQDLAAELPLVYCDASQIQQVVLNLLLNAAEAVQSRPQAGIRVSTRLAAPGAVTLSVRDSGEGIPAGNLSRIFDPFFTTKGEGKGVGLGLAVSYGIVEAHGGEIEVNSKVGEGTEFVVKLPVMAAHAMEQAG